MSNRDRRDEIVAALKRESEGSFATIHEALTRALKKSGGGSLTTEDVVRQIKTIKQEREQDQEQNLERATG